MDNVKLFSAIVSGVKYLELVSYVYCSWLMAMVILIFQATAAGMTNFIKLKVFKNG